MLLKSLGLRWRPETEEFAFTAVVIGALRVDN